eukprot:6779156-Pyramimonas_sp.AAC.1
MVRVRRDPGVPGNEWVEGIAEEPDVHGVAPHRSPTARALRYQLHLGGLHAHRHAQHTLRTHFARAVECYSATQRSAAQYNSGVQHRAVEYTAQHGAAQHSGL